MNTIVYYLHDVLAYLTEKAIKIKKEVKKRPGSKFEEGELWGYCFTLSKILNLGAVFGHINYLPKRLQCFDPFSLVKDLSKARISPTQMVQGTVKAGLKDPNEDFYLTEVLKQLITDAIDLRESVKIKNDFDDGRSFAYYCTILHLLNQAEGFDLSDNLPKALQDFVPEHLGHIKKSDLGL